MARYNAWLSDKKCNPIEKTDRIFNAPTKRWVVKHLAHENNIKVEHNTLIVRLPNGNCWNVSKL